MSKQGLEYFPELSRCDHQQPSIRGIVKRPCHIEDIVEPGRFVLATGGASA
jgi:hypothetical protein